MGKFDHSKKKKKEKKKMRKNQDIVNKRKKKKKKMNYTCAIPKKTEKEDLRFPELTQRAEFIY